MRGAAPILWDVVEEHLDEAAFLSTQWEAALVSPRHTVRSVARGPESRLLAHVDGLVDAGVPVADRVLAPALASDEPERVFAAALALLEGSRVEQVVTALRSAPAARRPALVRALGLTRSGGVVRELLAVARLGDPATLGASLDALAARRTLPPPAALSAALGGKVPGALAPALRAARLGGRENAAAVERAFAARDVEVRDAALGTGLVLGLRSAWETCQRLVEARVPTAAFPLLALSLGGEPVDVERISAALSSEALRPAALVALGHSGRVQAADACVKLLGDRRVGRIAGEAFAAITGLALEGAYTLREEEPGEPPRFEEEDLEADLVPGPEAQLPVPDPDAIGAWWRDARRRFDAKVRYLDGRRWDAATLWATLDAAPQRRRHALALEVLIRSRGEVDVETRTWAADQLRAHRARPLAAAPEFELPLGKLLQG